MPIRKIFFFGSIRKKKKIRYQNKGWTFLLLNYPRKYRLSLFFFCPSPVFLGHFSTSVTAYLFQSFDGHPSSRKKVIYICFSHLRRFDDRPEHLSIFSDDQKLCETKLSQKVLEINKPSKRSTFPFGLGISKLCLGCVFCLWSRCSIFNSVIFNGISN